MRRKREIMCGIFPSSLSLTRSLSLRAPHKPFKYIVQVTDLPSCLQNRHSTLRLSPKHYPSFCFVRLTSGLPLHPSIAFSFFHTMLYDSALALISLIFFFFASSDNHIMVTFPSFFFTLTQLLFYLSLKFLFYL